MGGGARAPLLLTPVPRSAWHDHYGSADGNEHQLYSHCCCGRTRDVHCPFFSPGQASLSQDVPIPPCYREQFGNLMGSVKDNGLTPQVHSNAKRRPKHSLSLASTEYVRFLYSYAEQHALLLPGWIPEYTCTDLQLVPSSVSKRGVWKVYCEAAEGVS